MPVGDVHHRSSLLATIIVCARAQRSSPALTLHSFGPPVDPQPPHLKNLMAVRARPSAALTPEVLRVTR